jgi:hypothetical protein
MVRARVATAVTTGGTGLPGLTSRSSASHSSAAASAIMIELSGASRRRPADGSASGRSAAMAPTSIARRSPSARYADRDATTVASAGAK